MNAHPRLNGTFNLLIGIFLLLAGWGVLYYSGALYAEIFPPACNGFGCGVGTPYVVDTFSLSGLYIMIGIGVAILLFAMKLIVFGVLDFSRQTNSAVVPSKQEPVIVQESKKNVNLPAVATAPPPPPPPETSMQTKVTKCAFCGAELPAEATYCPNCFQKVRTIPVRRNLLQ